MAMDVNSKATTFTKIHEQYKTTSGFTGTSKSEAAKALRLKNQLQTKDGQSVVVTKLYTKPRMQLSGSGVEKAQIRDLKFRGAADMIKQSIDNELGAGWGEKILQKVGQGRSHDLSTKILRSDLNDIKQAVDEAKQEILDKPIPKEIDKLCQDTLGKSGKELREEVLKLMEWPPAAVDHIKLSKNDYGDLTLQIEGYGGLENMLVDFSKEESLVDLRLAKVDQSLQGKGAMSRLFLGLTTIMKSSDTFKTMTMEANISVGGYAWARYGFTPDLNTRDGRDDFSEVGGKCLRRLEAVLNNMELSGPQKEKIEGVKQELKEALGKADRYQYDDIDPKIFRKIAALDISITDPDKSLGQEGYKERMSKAGIRDLTVGKHCLLGTSWKANFNVDKDMPYMEAYLGMRIEQSDKLAFLASKLPGGTDYTETYNEMTWG